MTPKRTDECQTCGHTWESHWPYSVDPKENSDISCAWIGNKDWCKCPEFVLRELLPQLDQQP